MNPRNVMAYRLIFIFWISLFECWAQSQNTNLACPNFEENTFVTLDLEVVNSSFSASCDTGPTTVTCYFQPPNEGPLPVCVQSVEKCETPLSALGCRCVRETGTGYTYALQFKAEESKHLGGNFSCDFDCIIITAGKTSPPVDIDSGCLNINITIPTPTMPPTTGTTVAPTTSPPDTTSASPKPPGQESVLLWLLLLLLLLIPPLILIIIFCCPCGNIACHWCCCTGRCYCRCADKAGTGCCGAAWCKKEDNFISHVCYLCGYKKVKEEEEFICCSLEKCEVVPTTRSGQRDNKVDADHVATNGARNRERVSTPVQETELTKVRETSSPPSGEEETSPNGSVRALPMPKVPVAAPSSRLPPLHSSTLMTSVERNSQVLDEPHNSRPLPLPGIKSTKM